MAETMKVCDNCDGDGGYEVAIPATSKWGDPTPDGEWIVCKYCDGLGYVEGEPELIEQEDLPPVRGSKP